MNTPNNPHRWMDVAACAATADEGFANIDSRAETAQTNDRLLKQRLAARYCQRCPSVRECSEFADEHRYVGLWGGYHRTESRAGYTALPLIPDPPAHVPYKGGAQLRSAS